MGSSEEGNRKRLPNISTYVPQHCNVSYPRRLKSSLLPFREPSNPTLNLFSPLAVRDVVSHPQNPQENLLFTLCVKNMHIYKYAQSRIIHISLQQHVSVTSTIIIKVSFNDNTIRIQIIIQEYMMKPLNVTFNLLYRVSWSQNIKILSLMFVKIIVNYVMFMLFSGCISLSRFLLDK